MRPARAQEAVEVAIAQVEGMPAAEVAEGQAAALVTTGVVEGQVGDWEMGDGVPGRQ